MGNRWFTRFGTLHGVTHRGGQNAAHFTGFTQGQQTRQIVVMQTGTRGIVHQHPLRVPGSLNARQNGVSPLCAAVNDGNLRMIRQRELRKTCIAGAEGNNNAFHPGMRQQRRHGVLEDRFIAN